MSELTASDQSIFEDEGFNEAPFNGLTPAEDERLSLLAEECAEVIVIVNKIMRHGYDSYHPDDPNTSNRTLLEKEVGHVLAALGLMINAQDVDEDELTQHDLEKRKTILQWLHHQPLEVVDGAD